MTWMLPQHAQLLSLSSHMHARGEIFRIWLPPNEPCVGTSNCLPPQTTADYESRLYDDPVYPYYDPPNDYSSAATTRGKRVTATTRCAARMACVTPVRFAVE